VGPHAVTLFKYWLKNEKTMGHDEQTRVSLELHRELGLKPWDENVLDFTIEEEMPKSYLKDEIKQAGWLKAQSLRRQLIAMT
jgi:hypothetical protein